ncbi:MAG: hypothetical protein V1908_03200 [Candidatus Peregrinibacteria bacterium]
MQKKLWQTPEMGQFYVTTFPETVSSFWCKYVYFSDGNASILLLIFLIFFMKIMEKFEHELHAKFVEYGSNSKTWMRKCILLLPEIEKHRIWKKKGFASIYEYAAKLAGMTKNTVDDALRILEKISGKPNLQLVAEAKGLGAVRPVVTMATPDTEKFWARKAAAMSIHTLETYVREVKRQGGVDIFRHVTEIQNKKEDGMAVNRDERVCITMDLDQSVAEMLLKLKGQEGWNTLMKELLEMREEKLASEQPTAVVNAKRYIPARIKNHVLRKTNGACAYQGCTKPYKILHHTQRFALHPEHDPQTLIPLCNGHERLAHHGMIEMEQERPEQWRVRGEAKYGSTTYAIDRKVMSYRKYK